MTDLASARTGGASPPDLWDRVVRLSHWGIAAVVLGNEVITKGGSPLHVWLGWTALALLALRIVWGVIGTAEARFTAFPPDPNGAVRHVCQLIDGYPPQYRSHNPAGAMMIYVLWGAVAVMGITGLVMSGLNPLHVAEQQAIVDSGNWADLAAQSGDAVTSTTVATARWIHEGMANLILLLVSLHIGGVVVESLMMRRNLLAPMLAGRGKPQKDENRAGP